ncbi:MAG: hypothetical protein RLZZ397_1359, partial [Pseudomonadota bacterium]
QGIDAVRQAYESAVGSDKLGQGLLSWRVQAPAAVKANEATPGVAP